MQYTLQQNEELLNEVKALLLKHIPVMFIDKLVVKTTPHNQICKLYGLIKNRVDDLLAYDGESWYLLNVNQINVGYVLQSIKQRLIGMSINNNTTNETP